MLTALILVTSPRDAAILLAGLVAVALAITVAPWLRRVGVDAQLQPLEAAALTAAIPAVLLVSMQGVRATSHATVSDVCLTGAGLLAVLTISQHQNRLAVPAWLSVSGGLLLVSVFLDLLLAPQLGGIYYDSAGALKLTNPHSLASLQLVGLFAISLLATPIVLGILFDTPRLVRLAANLFVTGALINAVVAISDYKLHTRIGPRFTGLSFGSATPGGPTLRVAGLTTHPNILALVAVMATPIAVSLALSSSKPRVRAAYLAAVGVLLAAIAFSGSRTGVLVVGLGLLVLAFHPLRHGRLLAGTIAATLFTVVIAYATGFAQNSNIVAISRLSGSGATAAGVAQSNQLRGVQYSNAFSELVHNPIGGIGFDALRGSQDVYLQLGQSGGVLALVSFLVFAGGVVMTGRSLARSPRLDAASQNLAMALTGSTVAWLVFSVAQPTLNDRFVYVPAGLILGLAARRRGAATG